MSKLTVMDQSGDYELAFDEKTGTGVAEAEREFDRLLGRGHAAFRGRLGEGGSRIMSFDVTAPEIVMVPLISGG